MIHIVLDSVISSENVIHTPMNIANLHCEKYTLLITPEVA